MRDIREICEYLMKYEGIHYKKPIDKDDKMMELKLTGQNVRSKFKSLGREVEKEFKDYAIVSCTNWVNQAQIVPSFLWIEFKKIGFENCPSSISLAVKKVNKEVYFYAAVEIKDIKASEKDFKRHNKILDMNLVNKKFYYSGDNYEYFHAGNNKETVEKLIEKKIIKKVRIQKEFNFLLNKTRKEIVDEIVDTIKKLEVYYNIIITDYNRSTEKDSENYSNLNSKEKSSFGWIIPCNPKYYDVVGAFNELNKIEWKQSTNIKVGDIVYIYVGGPYKEIKYKCVAKRVDLTLAERIDDSKYILNDTNYKNYGRYMELELLVKYEDQQYPFKKVKEYGPKSIQGPIRVTRELNNYIKLLELNNNKIFLNENNNADGSLLRDINLIVGVAEEYDYNYENKPKVKQNPTIQNGIKIYKRDKRVSINALAHAKFLCEVDNKHYTFIRKNTELNYTEPHHLIPMAYSDMFNFSLDVEENVVSLCSNCHNQIHYGRDYKDMLKKLYDERIDKLKKVGLYIKFEELLEMY